MNVDSEPIELSVVIPVYRSAGCLNPLYRRLKPALEQITLNYEVTFVDDCSPDGAWGILQSLAACDPRLRTIRQPHNTGQQAAIAAGVARSRGNWVVVMDGDLEHRPEDIEQLYTRAQDGFDIVFAEFAHHRQTRLRSACRAAMLSLLQLLGASRPAGVSTFSVLSRRAVAAYLHHPECNNVYVILLLNLGLPVATLRCEKGERAEGRSSYRSRELTRVGLRVAWFAWQRRLTDEEHTSITTSEIERKGVT